ncbi:MAG TPA: transposase [Solirubrobacterales bacterium]|nr:transposase [Solirubrobacterales bacterium]
MKTQTTCQTVEVTADAEGIVSHAGARLLAELADKVRLTAALSEAMAPTRERRSAHDPGVVLRDLIVSIADGGDCVTDLGVLRDQGVLFGSVASERTAHRVIKSIDAELLEAIRGARAIARERAWEAGARPEEITFGVDATLLGAASEKEGAAGNYKGGFGFHPLLCYLDETGEGSEAGEPEDGRVSQVNDVCFGWAQPGQPLPVDQRLRDHPAWPQQAPELLDEGADRLPGEVASA